MRVDLILLGRVKVIRIELRTRKETIKSFTYYPSIYSECVIVHIISPTTSNASLINHFILAPGVCSNLTICGSVLHHNFGRVWLLTLS